MNNLKHPKNTTLVILSVIVLFAMTPMITYSQDSVLLEEIIITAQKREQSLQDVGVSVTAFTGEQLKKLGYTMSQNLVAQVPGVESFSLGSGNTFTIRGVGQNDYTANQEAPVSVYVDETYVASNFSSRFAIFDIERIEVLRGPQGTLFGRNSTGGLLNFITVKPSEDAGGYIDVSIGDKGRRRIETAVGGQVGENALGRLSFVYNKDDGLIENDIGENSRRADDHTVRGQLLFQPSSDVEVLLKAQHGKEDGAANGFSHALPEGSATDFFGYAGTGDPYKTSTNRPFYLKGDVTDLMARITLDKEEYTVTSITNTQDITHAYASDSDVSPSDAFAYQQTADIKQISQELRLNWSGTHSRSVLGAYYLNIDGKYTSNQRGAIYFGPLVLETKADQDTTTTAIFYQTERDLSDQLMFTAGLRYNKDEKDYTLSSVDFGFAPYSPSISDSDWNGKLQFDYSIDDDTLVYAGVHRGIKGGGFNNPLTPVSTGDIVYDGETLISYEGGIKKNLSDRARVNASVFVYDYSDYQAYFIDGGFNTTLFNAEASTHGAEIEFTSNPVDGLDIILGASYVDTEVSELSTAIAPSGQSEAPLAPKWSLNGLARYAWPTSDGGEFSVQGDFRWVDDHYFSLAQIPVLFQGSYAVVNARLGYTSMDEKWTATLFVNNLTDERYNYFAYDALAFFGSYSSNVGDERWVGASISYRW
jgi:iron complex outermembrane receptor protein